jgi:hypothetical protein
MKQKRWLDCKLKLIMLFLLFFLVITHYPNVHANNQGTDLIVELSTTSIESGKNFTVSVYDPQIQNATPYLVNATIFFNNQYFQIYPEDNGEIVISAPEVDSYKSFTIDAFVDNKMGNATIVVYPVLDNNQLVVTTDSYLVSANEQFMVIITDQTGNAIENVAVSILNGNNDESTLTDSNGKAFLLAPNQESIDIIAKKQGYLDVMETIPIKTIPSQLDQILSNPQTPIIIAFVILLLSIFYVSLLKPFYHKKMKGMLKKGSLKKKTSLYLLIDKKRKKYGTIKLNENKPVTTMSNHSRIENIQRDPDRKLSKAESSNKDIKQKSSFQWFTPKKTLEQQDMSAGSTTNDYKKNIHEQKELHEKIDKLILEKEKKKTIT